jgi:hypothetical protein
MGQNSLLSLLGNSPLILSKTDRQTDRQTEREREREINIHYSFEFNNYNIFYPVVERMKHC